MSKRVEFTFVVADVMRTVSEYEFVETKIRYSHTNGDGYNLEEVVKDQVKDIFVIKVNRGGLSTSSMMSIADKIMTENAELFYGKCVFITNESSNSSAILGEYPKIAKSIEGFMKHRNPNALKDLKMSYMILENQSKERDSDSFRNYLRLDLNLFIFDKNEDLPLSNEYKVLNGVEFLKLDIFSIDGFSKDILNAYVNEGRKARKLTKVFEDLGVLYNPIDYVNITYDLEVYVEDGIYILVATMLSYLEEPLAIESLYIDKTITTISKNTGFNNSSISNLLHSDTLNILSTKRLDNGLIYIHCILRSDIGGEIEYFINVSIFGDLMYSDVEYTGIKSKFNIEYRVLLNQEEALNMHDSVFRSKSISLGVIESSKNSIELNESILYKLLGASIESAVT